MSLITRTYSLLLCVLRNSARILIQTDVNGDVSGNSCNFVTIFRSLIQLLELFGQRFVISFLHTRQECHSWIQIPTPPSLNFRQISAQIWSWKWPWRSSSTLIGLELVWGWAGSSMAAYSSSFLAYWTSMKMTSFGVFVELNLIVDEFRFKYRYVFFIMCGIFPRTVFRHNRASSCVLLLPFLYMTSRSNSARGDVQRIRPSFGSSIVNNQWSLLCPANTVNRSYMRYGRMVFNAGMM